MQKSLTTLLCAALFSLSGTLSANATTPFIAAEQPNVFADWTPNQLAKVQSTVDLVVFLPSEGIYNDWDITLTGSNGAYYEFHTSDASFQYSGYASPLGTILEGTYDVSFHNRNSREAFVEYSFCETQWWRTGQGNNDITISGINFVGQCNQIVIDAEIRTW